MVHQVGNASDPTFGHTQGLDELEVGLRRRRHRDRIPVVDVVDHPNRHAPRRRVLDRSADDRRGLGRKVEVVLRKVEGLLGPAEEGLDLTGDLDRLLAAVGQRLDAQKLGAQRTLTRPPSWRQRPEWKRSILVRSTG